MFETYNDELNLALSFINSKEKHKFYDRVCKLARKYEILITGEDTGELLKKYATRETEEAFKQRIELTSSITPAISDSLIKPFQRASRTDKIKKNFDFKNKRKNQMIREMVNSFNSGESNKVSDLDYWLKQRFLELSFTNPNAWIVLEWDKAEPNQTPTPYPVEVYEDEALNFKFKKGNLQWLLVQKEVAVKTIKDGLVKSKKGEKYIWYGKQVTIVCDELDDEFLKSGKLEILDNQEVKDLLGKRYLITILEHKTGEVPAFRIGYKTDLKTKSKTFVNPFHSAMCWFDKSIKAVSEFDLTMTHHTFPQKLVYLDKCSGFQKEGCTSGINHKGNTCKSCKGTGLMVHKSAQDVIALKKPATKEEMIPLDDLIAYKSPPIDLVRFQKEFVDSLEISCHKAVYNSTFFVQAEIGKTATEADFNMQSIYDAIEPYTEKYSEVWKSIINLFSKIVAVPQTDNYTLYHVFPANLNIKSLGALLSDLEKANESGAPSFLIDSINKEIADVVYMGDDDELKRFETKRAFYPFNGKSPDEIAMLMTSEFVSQDTKILYSNFDQIFNDIEKEVGKHFIYLSHAKQWEYIQAKIVAINDEIKSGEPVMINFREQVDADENKGDAPDENNPSKGDGNSTNDFEEINSDI